MSVQSLLSQIRPIWLQRISHDLVRGAGVRENFEKQLIRFYDLLEQAIMTGDFSWIDPLLIDWANVPTLSDLEDDQMGISALINQMISLTYDIARNSLEPEPALDYLNAVIPALTYSLEKIARLETEMRVTHISNQLVDVEQKLERLDRSKSNFIAVAAHELKTPLTLIEGYTSMMRDHVLQSTQNGVEPLLKGVNNGIRRLREIVDDLIDVSLIDNNLLSLNFQPIWIGHILGLLKSELEEFTEEREQLFSIEAFPGSDQIIFADPERLHQALRNILTNAIKYTPNEGTITVDGRLLPGFIELIISDSGIGISREDQSLIFEKFSQVGQAALHSSGKTKFKGGGPGLGLPIARGIIEAHGGTIWVDSEGYDEIKCPGSIFHILLPVRGEAVDPKIEKLFGKNNPFLDETNAEKENHTDDTTA
jgi:signal transduction histidine kinase